MFDEPLSNLDAALRSRTRQEIANLHRRIKTAMIFVTHDQTEAMSLADRIVVMNQRRIEQIGTPLAIYGNPATEFVATFVGSPAMNILAVARAASSGAFARVTLGDGTQLETSLPASTAEAGTLHLGVRPEALRLCATGEGDTVATVEFVEFLGDKTHVYLALANGDRVVALAGAPGAVRTGDKVGLAFDARAAHLFGADGRNLKAAG
jgi:multiple sugar transport system ATP-binding protein